MKRFVSLMVALCMVLSLGAVAAAEAPSIAGQYYAYSFFAEGYGDYNFFFHFYEADPVLGAVFYAGLSNNKLTFSGLYTVEEAPYDYACCADRAAALADGGKVLTEGTAPYTVTFYDWDGTVIDQCGWDGQILYNDLETIIGSGSGPMFYHLDAEGKYQSTYDGEMGVSYLDFVAVDDDTCTVSLCHNMTYNDMMVSFLDGSWAIGYADDGSAIYTLTPFDETETGAVLTVSPDKQTAVYENEEGDTFDMVNMADGEAVVLYVGEGSAFVQAANADGALALEMYDDGTCSLTAKVFGAAATLDEGTYTVGANYTISFAFDLAGELTATLDMEQMAIVLAYAAEGTSIGAVDTTLVINEKKDTQPAALLFSFTGGYTSFDVYDDSTYTFSFAQYDLTETGTWTFENYVFTIEQSNGNVITADMDGDHALSFTYVAESNDQLKDTFTCDSATWGPALAK